MSLSAAGVSLTASAQRSDGYVPSWLVLVLAAVGAVVVLTAAVEVLVALVRRRGAQGGGG